MGWPLSKRKAVNEFITNRWHKRILLHMWGSAATCFGSANFRDPYTLKAPIYTKRPHTT